MSNKNFNEDDVSMYYPDGDSAHMADDDISSKQYSKKTKAAPRMHKRNSTISSKHWIIIAAVFIVYTVLLLTFSWLFFYRPYQTPDTTLPFETEAPSTSNGYDDPPLVNGNENNSDGNTEGYVAKEGVYNILLVGHDKGAHLADVTMIVNCDTVNNTISVMQIPRDTYVGLQLSTNKINEAFARYYNQALTNKSSNADLSTLDQYAAMLEKSLCINIHQTVLVNLDGFKNIVDAIGGVTLYVPIDMEYEDPEQDLYIYLSEGYQTLNGEQSEQFIRFRADYVQADLGRINAQKIFLTAMFNQVKAVIANLDIPAMSNLAAVVIKNVSTDMSTSDMIFYAKFMLKVELDSINMMTLPGNMAGNHYVANRKATLEAINKYFNIYSKEISDSIFDPKKLFCNISSTDACNVYFGDPEDILDGVHNAGDIDSESIDIPVLNN